MMQFYKVDNGTVVAFWSRAARNEWVNTEPLRNGVYHREIISAKEARCEMVRVAYDYMINEHIIWERSDLRYLPMDTLAEAYARVTL